MMIKKIILVMLLLGVSVSVFTWLQTDAPVNLPITELAWEDLVPADWQPPNIDDLYPGLLPEQDDDAAAIEIMSKLRTENKLAPVVEKLAGTYVKLPGFIVPLEFDASEITEFLLVPYMGACIHTPPPPANQVVYAQVEKKLKVEDLYDPVWLIGKIEIQQFSSELADAGYSMQEAIVLPYYDE